MLLDKGSIKITAINYKDLFSTRHEGDWQAFSNVIYPLEMKGASLKVSLPEDLKSRFVKR